MVIATRFIRLALAAASIAGHAACQNLPDRLTVGYWHNWTSPNALRLTDLPPDYDVVDIAFATPSAPGGVQMQFVPSPTIYPTLQTFIDDVAALQADGRKVVISIGGANDPIEVDSASDASTFATSMLALIDTYGFDGLDIDLEGQSLALLPGDSDFRAATSPKIVHFIDGISQILAASPDDFMLTAAPETAFVQGGYSTYGGIWGAYLPVLHALRDDLTFVHVQHYNTGSMFGRDGAIYAPATADFHVAMADMLLAGFQVDAFGADITFEPLAASQVAIGLPSSPAAAGSGYTTPTLVKQALDALYLGKPVPGGSYVLADPDGYPSMRGVMTWSINWDVANGEEFISSYTPYLDTLFLQVDTDTVSTSAGGAVTFTMSAGKVNALRNAFLLGSVTGTSPGLLLPGGHATLPVNFDALTEFILASPAAFPGFFTTLDDAGNANATLTVPPVAAALIGIELDFAYALGGPWDFASNAVGITLVP